MRSSFATKVLIVLLCRCDSPPWNVCTCNLTTVVLVPNCGMQLFPLQCIPHIRRVLGPWRGCMVWYHAIPTSAPSQLQYNPWRPLRYSCPLYHVSVSFSIILPLPHFITYSTLKTIFHHTSSFIPHPTFQTSHPSISPSSSFYLVFFFFIAVKWISDEDSHVIWEYL